MQSTYNKLCTYKRSGWAMYLMSCKASIFHRQTCRCWPAKKLPSSVKDCPKKSLSQPMLSGGFQAPLDCVDNGTIQIEELVFLVIYRWTSSVLNCLNGDAGFLKKITRVGSTAQIKKQISVNACSKNGTRPDSLGLMPAFSLPPFSPADVFPEINAVAKPIVHLGTPPEAKTSLYSSQYIAKCSHMININSRHASASFIASPGAEPGARIILCFQKRLTFPCGPLECFPGLDGWSRASAGYWELR